MLLLLILANLKMIYRNRQALFWALIFPLLFVCIFGLFRLDEPPEIDILLIDKANNKLSERLIDNLDSIEHVKLQMTADETKAKKALKDGDYNYLLIIPEQLTERLGTETDHNPVDIVFLYDRANQGAPIVIGVVQQFVQETNQELVKAPSLIELKPQGVQARQITYFDFLLPGFVGMGVMIYSIIGVASVIALNREQKIFKRILATPLKVRTMFAGQIIAHLILSVVQAVIIMAVGVLVFDGHIYGNLLWLLILVVIANIIFLNLGFIVGAVVNSVRAADGLANVIAMPMMFLSGTFFPKEGLPGGLATVVEYLPLSPLLDAMRGVALEAKPFWEYPTELAILMTWIVISSVIAIKVFKFT